MALELTVTAKGQVTPAARGAGPSRRGIRRQSHRLVAGERTDRAGRRRGPRRHEKPARRAATLWSNVTRRSHWPVGLVPNDAIGKIAAARPDRLLHSFERDRPLPGSARPSKSWRSSPNRRLIYGWHDTQVPNEAGSRFEVKLAWLIRRAANQPLLCLEQTARCGLAVDSLQKTAKKVQTVHRQTRPMSSRRCRGPTRGSGRCESSHSPSGRGDPD
jgi:hypothetical protein